MSFLKKYARYEMAKKLKMSDMNFEQMWKQNKAELQKQLIMLRNN